VFKLSLTIAIVACGKARGDTQPHLFAAYNLAVEADIEKSACALHRPTSRSRRQDSSADRTVAACKIEPVLAKSDDR